MGQVGPGVAGLQVTGPGAGQLELFAIGAAVLLALALLAVKAWFTRDRRHRRRRSGAYHQRDVARYSVHGVGRDEATDPRGQPLAPTFAAPGAGRFSRAARAERRAAVRRTPYGTVDPLSKVPGSFDPEEAQRLRPPSAPADRHEHDPHAEELDEDEDGERIPPPTGALPLLRRPRHRHQTAPPAASSSTD